jgi:UDP-2,3-diacylglucosamine pyrophosphatase LpxH
LKNHYKTLFISDTHLGSRTANATVLLDFLRNNHCDKLFIIGDFIDFWAMKRSVYFPPTHREIIRIILKWSARGVYIEYIPGNHDDDIRTFLPIFLDNVQVVRESTHTTKNGKRFLITHGDDYDQVIKYAKWLAWLGDVGYHGLIYANKFVNFCRMHFGYGHWSNKK